MLLKVDSYWLCANISITLTDNYSYLDGEAQARNVWTGKNSNDLDADRLTGQDQRQNGHLGMYVLVLPLPGLYPCVISGQWFN